MPLDDIDYEIKYERERLEKMLNSLYRVEYWDVVDENSGIDAISCLECGNDVYRFINSNYPCPKCDGKVVVTGFIITD